VLAVLAAAVLLAAFGLPYGKSHPKAFAHVYTFPGNGNYTHLHIDADISNGGRPCDPIDATATVTVGSKHKVGVCLEDYVPNSVAEFELHIRYNGDPDAVPPTTINSSPTELPPPVWDPGDPLADPPIPGGWVWSCPVADPHCLDVNPDANDGNDPTGFKLGGGWDCSVFGIAPPVGEDPQTPHVADAFMACWADLANPDQDLSANPGLLATIEFTATNAGVDTIDFGPIDATNANQVQSPRPGAGVARCGTAVPADQVGCFGATIHKVAAPTPTVPNFQQCDAPWGDDLYDSIDLYVTGRSDVCWWGCALTSAVDVLNYWGVSTTPDALNEWLLGQQYGYCEGGVNWNAVAKYAQERGVHLAPPKYYRDSNVGALQDSLESGHPVILGVAYGGRNPGHWVVATGPNADTWWINDPGGVGAATLQGYGNTFSRRVLYEPDSGNSARLVLKACSPVDLVITDPQGRRLGFDPASGTSYEEIPDAWYGVDGTIAGGDGSGEILTGVKTAWLNAPVDGQYALEVIGTGTGMYTVHAEAYDRDGNYSPIEGPSGTTSPGQVDSALVHYTSQPPAVGGIAELPDVASTSAENARTPAEGSGWWADRYAALAGGLSAAVLAVAAGAWYARRRWLQ
jgi:hypothetical protein